MVEAFAVATITILAVISPGADFAMVTRNSMVASRRAGIFTAVGISLGVLVHVSYSMLGIGLLISKSIILFDFIKLAGAVYLVFLGVTMLKAKKPGKDAPEQNSALSEKSALRMGFFTNALNPKTTLFVVALFTQVIHVETPTPVQLAYGAFMSIAHLIWFILVAYLFSSNAARSFVTTSRHLIERAIGGVLVALGVGLATSSIRQA